MESTQGSQDANTGDARKSGQEGKITVKVIYNGVPKEFEVQPQSDVQSLLARAIAEFKTHQLVLGWPNGDDVPTSGSIAAAGIVDDTTLLLRPHTVRGGRS